MKKTLLLAAFAFAGSIAFAQKPAAGDKTAEINLLLQVGTAPISYGLPMNANPKFANIPAELRFRYFLSDKSAIRLRLGMGSQTTKTAFMDPTGTTTSDVTVKSGFGIMLTPGYEMHFEGTDKLSPYCGGELGFMMAGSATTEVTNSDNASPTSATVKTGASYSSTGGSSIGIRLGLFMGADYYFTNSVYLGAEFGLGLFNAISTAEGTEKKKVSSGATEVTTKMPKSSDTYIFGTSVGGVRFGFKF
ncbi:MAG: hypothetical protein H7296_09510 [Bacteroidia bacterium]|nr:hypothetical protein [Bacteroidia bacterium]